MNSSSVKFILGGFVSAVVLFFAFGCSKTATAPSSSATFTARIGTDSLAPNRITAVYYGAASYIMISGTQYLQGDTLVLQTLIPTTISAGQTVLFDNGATILYTDSKGPKTYKGAYGSGHGSITLSTWDSTGHTISGTFSGTLVDSKGDSVVVSNGVYNTSYLIAP